MEGSMHSKYILPKMPYIPFIHEPTQDKESLEWCRNAPKIKKCHFPNDFTMRYKARLHKQQLITNL